MPKTSIQDYQTTVQDEVKQCRAQLLKNVRECDKKWGSFFGPIVSTLKYGITESELKNSQMTCVKRKKATDPVTEQDLRDYVKIMLEIYKLNRYQFLQKCGTLRELEYFIIAERDKRGISELRADAIQVYREKRYSERNKVGGSKKINDRLSDAWETALGFFKPAEPLPPSPAESIHDKQARRKQEIVDRKQMARK